MGAVCFAFLWVPASVSEYGAGPAGMTEGWRGNDGGGRAGMTEVGGKDGLVHPHPRTPS